MSLREVRLPGWGPHGFAEAELGRGAPWRTARSLCEDPTPHLPQGPRGSSEPRSPVLQPHDLGDEDS